jgi:hypothetical protein
MKIIKGILEEELKNSLRLQDLGTVQEIVGDLGVKMSGRISTLFSHIHCKACHCKPRTRRRIVA